MKRLIIPALLAAILAGCSDADVIQQGESK